MASHFSVYRLNHPSLFITASFSPINIFLFINAKFLFNLFFQHVSPSDFLFVLQFSLWLLKPSPLSRPSSHLFLFLQARYTEESYPCPCVGLTCSSILCIPATCAHEIPTSLFPGSWCFSNHPFVW